MLAHYNNLKLVSLNRHHCQDLLLSITRLRILLGRIRRESRGAQTSGGFDLCLTQSLDWDCFVRADAAVLNFEADDDDDQDQEGGRRSKRNSRPIQPFRGQPTHTISAWLLSEQRVQGV